jgi:FtsP/CotA-like multicopper oxidase with cupredoxin domain
MELSRREVLQIGGLSALAVAGLTVPLTGNVFAKSASQLDDRLMPRPYRTDFVVPPVLRPVESGVDDIGRYSKYIVNQVGGSARFLERVGDTAVWGYGGRVAGPTIHAEAGGRVIMRMRNRLPETHPMFGHPFTTSTHLHGNASLPEYDGYASDLTRPRFTKTYQWPNSFQPARTLWYHDHASHVTAEHVYSGFAGQFHVHDDTERALLPQRPYDVPLILSDVMFAADGSLGFNDRDHSGVWGDVVLVNGRPWPVMKVQRRVYRFRILNASVSRSYRPVLDPEVPFHFVATDGGMMPVSQAVTEFRMSPAERYEVLIDFRQFAAGQRVELQNRSNENNRDFDHTDKIMAFDVTDEPFDKSDPTWERIPTTLASSAAMSLRRDQSMRRRHMRLKKSDVTNIWSINERTWADVVASNFTEVFANPGLNDVETWTIENSSGGWFHPIHIHLVDFQILSRNGRAPFAYELGPKDTVYVGEGETVEVLMRFGPHRGKYMIHCHNLSHEDHDMMIQYSVGLREGEVDEHDPINKDPAAWDTDGDNLPTSVIEQEVFEPYDPETEPNDPETTPSDPETSTPGDPETSTPSDPVTTTTNPSPSVTEKPSPTKTPKPTRTPRPTRTPKSTRRRG